MTERSPHKAPRPAVLYQSGHVRLEEVLDSPGLYTLSIPRLKTGILIHARELLDVGEAVTRHAARLESEAKKGGQA